MTNLINEQEFTDIYIEVLKEEFPTIKIQSSAPLEVSSFIPDNEKEIKHFLDNCYNEYLTHPNELNEILTRYIQPLYAIYKPEEKPIIEQIFPMIKDKEYIRQVEKVMPNGGKLQMKYVPYNSELFVFYGIDRGSSIQSLQDDDFEALDITDEELHEIALDNLANTLEVQAQQDEHLIFLVADDNYEASLILLTDIWTKENFPVEGEIVIGIPARNVLAVCGSEETEGMAELQNIIDEVYKSSNHIISDKMFVFRNGKFEVL